MTAARRALATTLAGTVATALALLATACSASSSTAAPSRSAQSSASSPDGGTTTAPAASAAATPASSPAARRPAKPAATGPAAHRWRPRAGTAWQWQLSGTVDTGVDVPVYDIDGFENGAAVVKTLHAAGRKVICYVNVGAWESFRPDATAFPTALLGRSDGWEGERWLDIRRLDAIRPLMAARFDMCRSKGFDAVEPDNVDGYANATGFPLTAAQQLAFNRMIAGLAHDRGLAVGLKNDLDQVPALLQDFDFSVDEQCAQYGECAQLTPFVAAGKPVFHVEYDLRPSQFCAQARRLGLSSMAKHLELDAWRQAC